MVVVTFVCLKHVKRLFAAWLSEGHLSMAWSWSKFFVLIFWDSTVLFPRPLNSWGWLITIYYSEALSLKETNRILLSKPEFLRHYPLGVGIISLITFFSLSLECWGQEVGMQFQGPMQIWVWILAFGKLVIYLGQHFPFYKADMIWTLPTS